MFEGEESIHHLSLGSSLRSDARNMNNFRKEPSTSEHGEVISYRNDPSEAKMGYNSFKRDEISRQNAEMPSILPSERQSERQSERNIPGGRQLQNSTNIEANDFDTSDFQKELRQQIEKVEMQRQMLQQDRERWKNVSFADYSDDTLGVSQFTDAELHQLLLASRDDKGEMKPQERGRLQNTLKSANELSLDLEDRTLEGTIPLHFSMPHKSRTTTDGRYQHSSLDPYSSSLGNKRKATLQTSAEGLNTSQKVSDSIQSANFLTSQKAELLTGRIEENLRAEIQSQKDYIQSLTQSLKSKSNHIIKLSATIESFQEKKLMMEISWKKQLETQRNQMEKEMLQLKNQLEDEKQQLKKDYIVELKRTKEKFEDEKQQLKKDYIIELRDIKAKFDKEKSHSKEQHTSYSEQIEAMKLQITELSNAIDNLQMDRDKYVQLHLQSSKEVEKLKRALQTTREKAMKEKKDLEVSLKKRYETEMKRFESDIENKFGKEYQELLDKMSNLKNSRKTVEQAFEDSVQNATKLKEEYHQIKQELNALVKEQLTLRDENSNYKYNFMPKDEFQKVTEQHIESLKKLQNETRQIIQGIEQNQIVYDVTKPHHLTHSSKTFNHSAARSVTDFKALQSVFLNELDRLSSLLMKANAENQKLRTTLTQQEKTLPLWMKQKSVLFNNQTNASNAEKFGLSSYNHSLSQTFDDRRQPVQSNQGNHNMKTISHIDIELYNVKIQELEEQNESLKQQNHLLQERLSNIQGNYDLLLGETNRNLFEDTLTKTQTISHKAYLASPQKELSEQATMELYRVNHERREFEELLLKKLVVHICELQSISEVHFEEKIQLDIPDGEISQEDTTERISMEIGNAIRQLEKISKHYGQICENKSNLIHSLQKEVKKKSRQLSTLKKKYKIPLNVTTETPERKRERISLPAPYSPTIVHSDDNIKKALEKILPFYADNIESAVTDLVATVEKSSQFISTLQNLMNNGYQQSIADRIIGDSLGHIVIRNDALDDQDVQIINLQKLSTNYVKILRESLQLQQLMPQLLLIEKETATDSSFNDPKQTLLRVKMHVEKMRLYIHHQPSALQDISKYTQSTAEEYAQIVEHAKSIFNVTHSRDLMERLEEVYLENKSRENLHTEYTTLCQTLKSLLNVEHSNEIIDKIKELKHSDEIVASLDEKVRQSPTSVQNHISKYHNIVKELCRIMEVSSSKELESKAEEWKGIVNHIQQTIKEFTGELLDEENAQLQTSDFIDRYLDM